MYVSRLLFTFAAVVFIQAHNIETGGEECSFTEGDFSASWELDGNNVHFHVTKKNMDDNTWTAVAFGPSMQEALDIAMIKVVDGEVSVTDEKVFEYGPSTKDDSQDIHVESKSYTNKNLEVKFTRPVAAGNNKEDRDLKQTPVWQFATKGGPICQNGDPECTAGDVKYHFETPIGKSVDVTKCSS